MQQNISYKIKGLDCAEEVTVLKEGLGTKSGIVALEFDLLNSKMTVIPFPIKSRAGAK